jgi:hypothetical protein
LLAWSWVKKDSCRTSVLQHTEKYGCGRDSSATTDNVHLSHVYPTRNRSAPGHTQNGSSRHPEDFNRSLRFNLKHQSHRFHFPVVRRTKTREFTKTICLAFIGHERTGLLPSSEHAALPIRSSQGPLWCGSLINLLPKWRYNVTDENRTAALRSRDLQWQGIMPKVNVLVFQFCFSRRHAARRHRA